MISLAFGGDLLYNLLRTCRCDGIGRRSGLKIHRWRQRTGSSPVTGTKKAAPRWGAAFLHVGRTRTARGPRRSPAERVRRGEDEQRNERDLRQQGERYGACEDEVRSPEPTLKFLCCKDFRVFASSGNFQPTTAEVEFHVSKKISVPIMAK